MNFAVVWNPSATVPIDDAWVAAAKNEQEDIALALGRIQSRLSGDPEGCGESRSNTSTRVFTERPVTVHFRIIARLNLVRVFAARVYRRRA
ncbi:MAG: hypothetical protein AAF790_09285 [Planctomycetota bacterium]